MGGDRGVGRGVCRWEETVINVSFPFHPCSEVFAQFDRQGIPPT